MIAVVVSKEVAFYFFSDLRQQTCQYIHSLTSSDYFFIFPSIVESLGTLEGMRVHAHTLEHEQANQCNQYTYQRKPENHIDTGRIKLKLRIKPGNREAARLLTVPTCRKFRTEAGKFLLIRYNFIIKIL